MRVRQGALSSQVLPASSSKAPSIDPNVLGICCLAWDPKTGASISPLP